MRILAFAASLRKESFNRKLALLASRRLEGHGAQIDWADFSEFDMPLFNGDEQAAHGLPPGARALASRLEAADALLLASPEYNYSIAGPLKNAIDWVSRLRPMPWRGKPTYLLSASISTIGGHRGLWQTRIPLEACGALVFPNMFGLALAQYAFAEDGGLLDKELEKKLDEEMAGFLLYARALLPAAQIKGIATTEQKELNAALEAETAIQPG